MIYIAVLLGILALASWRISVPPEWPEKLFPRIRVALATLAALALIASVVVVIPPGNTGVGVLFGRVQDTPYEEGFHLRNPFVSIERYSIRTETYTMNSGNLAGEGRVDDSIYVLSSDGVQMPMDVSMAYRLSAHAAPFVYQHLGRYYVESVLRPAARSAIPEAVAKYTFQEAYAGKREELATRMRDTIQARIRSIVNQYKGVTADSIVIQEIFLRKIELPPNLKASIEQKMQSEQEASRMSFVIQREEREAERKRIEARGIRDFQAIVSDGISDKLLQWKGIEATESLAKSANAKMVIVGSGKSGLPVILQP